MNWRNLKHNEQSEIGIIVMKHLKLAMLELRQEGLSIPDGINIIMDQTVSGNRLNGVEIILEDLPCYIL